MNKKQHDWQCGWHLDQYTWECDCGLTAPRKPYMDAFPKNRHPTEEEIKYFFLNMEKPNETKT